MKKYFSLLTLGLVLANTMHAQLVPSIAADVNTGSSSSNPCAITSAGTRLFFQAEIGSRSVYELTTSGSNVVPGMYGAAYNFGPMSYFNGKLYACIYLSSVSATNIFSYDLSSSVSVRACDSVKVVTGNMAELGGKLYFFGQNSYTSMYGMYYFDASGTVHLAGNVSSSLYILSCMKMVASSGKLYFITEGSSPMLYSFDPATNTFADPLGTLSNVGSLVAGDDGKIYYSDKVLTSGEGRELYSYSGSGSAVKLTALNGSSDGLSIPPNAVSPYYGHNILKWGTKIYFSGCDGAHGYELMCYDLSTSTSSLVLDINTGSVSSEPACFVAYAGKLYFSAESAANGRELWVTDGTTAGTHMVADTYPGTNGSNAWYMAVHTDGMLYMSANDGTSGAELYKMSGTNGVMQVSSVKSLNAFPNPASGICVLAVDLLEAQGVTVTITDNSGRSITSASSLNKQLQHKLSVDMSAFVAGMYFYRVTGQNGAMLASGNIVH